MAVETGKAMVERGKPFVVLSTREKSSFRNSSKLFQGFHTSFAFSTRHSADKSAVFITLQGGFDLCSMVRGVGIV